MMPVHSHDLSGRRYLCLESKSRQGSFPGWGRRCREFEKGAKASWRINETVRNAEDFWTLSKTMLGRASDNTFQPLMKSHVYAHNGVWWDVISETLHVSRHTRHYLKDTRASSPFAEVSSARDLGACVLDHSTQSSTLGGQTSVHAQAGQLVNWAM